MSLISMRGLTYTYAGAEAPALREIELEIEPGEFVVLAGMSGSGKSTLLRAISGLVPHFHGGSFAGTVTVAGTAIAIDCLGQRGHSWGAPDWETISRARLSALP